MIVEVNKYIYRTSAKASRHRAENTAKDKEHGRGSVNRYGDEE
jgi:hypothetical protein